MWWARETAATAAVVAGLLVFTLVIYAVQYKNTRVGRAALSVREMVQRYQARYQARSRKAERRSRWRESTRMRGRPARRRLSSGARADRSSDVVVVFDFDETLGCFQELSDLSQAIANQRRRQLEPHEHAELLRILPHYTRPGIVEQLAWLYEMKRSEMPWLKVMIYTNNMGGRKWVKDVASALELLVKESLPPASGRRGQGRLFDQIIYAYSVDGVHLEKRRTSHEKKYIDFLACTRYKHSTKVIFVDDVLHRGMLLTPHVKYLHVPAYKWLYGRARIEKMVYRHYVNDPGNVADANIRGVLSCLNYGVRPTDVGVLGRHEAVAARLRKEIESGIKWAREPRPLGVPSRYAVAGGVEGSYVAL